MSELPAGVAEQLASLSGEFRRSLPGRLGEIVAAFNALGEDWNEAALVTLRGVCHRLAGAAGTFGLPVLGETAREIEDQAQCLCTQPERRSDSARAALQALLTRLLAEISAAAPEAERPAPMPIAASRRIFLVDDDRLLGTEIAEKLNQYGYEARVFEEPAAMLEALRSAQPDALVFDLMFPDGLLDQTLLVEARALAPVPLLVVSARDDLAARIHALRAGCDAYLTKPLDIGVLVDRLDDLLHKTDHQPARVLVVEDDEITGRALIAVLEGGGMRAELVSHPDEVLARLRDVLPDLVLMDMYLPGCRGDELAAVIRQIDAWQGVPITYLSVEADRERQLQALEHGGDDFLQKPIDPRHLLRAVGARIRRARRLRAMMTRDSLTGLFNHARFMEQLDVEAMRARRGGKPLSVAMIDIDHFKAVNDSHGHAAGDVVIKSLARLLLQRLRQVDVIGRYGGEEFAVVMPETSLRAAREVIEEIGRSFASLRFRRPAGEFSVSFSAGIASLDDYGGPRHLIEAADWALYDAKHRGRNRVEIAAVGTGGQRDETGLA